MAALRSKLSLMPEDEDDLRLGVGWALADAVSEGEPERVGMGVGAREGMGLAVGAGTGLGPGELHRLKAITKTRSTTAAAPIMIVRGLIGEGGGGMIGSVIGGLGAAWVGAGSVAGATAMAFVAPQSGHAGRFTGS